MSDYSKPFLTIEEQLELLQNRRMQINDSKSAANFLGDVGYYKFSGYAYPFRRLGAISPNKLVTRSHDYQANTIFEDIMKLYQFDRKLSALLVEALVLFELKLRTSIAIVLGAQEPHFHTKRNCLKSEITDKEFDDFIKSYNSDIDKSKNKVFVKHFRNNYGSEMPIWVAIEVLQFGTLSRLYRHLKAKDKLEIARIFKIPSMDLFENLIDSFRRLRNECAHHGQIWNAEHQPHLNNLVNHWPDASHLLHIDETQKMKIYGKLTLLIYFLTQVAGENELAKAIKVTLVNFPAIPIVSPEADMGFPENWLGLDFWKAI